MKTRHFLSVMALPMLFAACTADELTAVDNGIKDDSSLRPVVEGVKIAFNGAATRAVQGDKFNSIEFVKGDKVGALQVDQLMSATEKDPIERYDLLTTAFNTNYVFETQDGKTFAAEAYMTEGNYVFYYPFNTLRTRDKIETDLPVEQKLTKGADGAYTSFPYVLKYSEEKGAPLAVAYDFISSTDADKTVQNSMKQIYAVPLITLKNEYTESVSGKPVAKSIKIKQIVLTNNAQFTVKAPLQFATIASQTAYTQANGTNNSVVAALFNEEIPADKAAVTKKGYWLDKVNSATGTTTGNILGAATEKNGEIVLTLDTPVEVEAEGTFSFYAVIPAANYTVSSFKIQVVNEKGYSTGDLDINNDATLIPGKRYPAEEYNKEGEPTAAAGERLTATVSTFSANGILVSTPQELLKALKNAAGNLTIRMSESAALDKTVTDYLGSTAFTHEVEFVNTATMTGTSTLAPLNKVTFSAGVIVAEGAKVTFDESSNIVVKNKLDIKAGATVIYKQAGMDAAATIENAGTLNLEDAPACVINNAGTVSIVKEKSVSLSKAFNNGNDRKDAAILNIEEKATLALTAEDLTNMEGAIINNYGILQGDQYLKNNEKAVINNGTEENFMAQLTANGIGSINEGLINNYATLDIQSNNGKGTIEVMGNYTTTTVAAGNGTVINDELGTVTPATNTVIYTVSGALKDMPTTPAECGITDYYFGNVTITLDNRVTKTVTQNVTIIGNTKFSGEVGLNATVTFAASKTLVVNKGAILTVGIGNTIAGSNSGKVDMTNNGSVINQGTISADLAGNGSWIGNVAE